MNKIIPIIFIILLAGVILLPGAHAQFLFMFENPLVDHKVPEFNVETMDGQTIHSKDIFSDDPAIIFFWATWCPHCRAALDELNKDRLQFKKDAIKVVLINLGENKQTVERYLKKNNIQMDVYLDQRQALGDTFAIVGLPTFCFVNDKGIVVEIGHELIDDYRDVLRPSAK